MTPATAGRDDWLDTLIEQWSEPGGSSDDQRRRGEVRAASEVNCEEAGNDDKTPFNSVENGKRDVRPAWNCGVKA